MTGKLAHRLEQIPGIAAVNIDLTDTGGGIEVRLEPDADEIFVMEKLRELLVAYGIRSADPRVELERVSRSKRPEPSFDVEVTITPLSSGARVEVTAENVRSFRVVPATPTAIVQGLSDAWCHVVGRIPVEIVDVSMSDAGDLEIVASDGERKTVGRANVSQGWESALTRAVGEALGMLNDPGAVGHPLVSNSS